MKKIVFVMTSLNTGGIKISLINLLNELKANEDLKADLILFRRNPPDEDIVPDNVRIMPAGNMAELIAISLKEAKSKGLGCYIKKCFFGFLCKIFGHGIAYKTLFAFSKRYYDYDCAISCSQSAPFHDMYGGCNEYVLSNIKAKKKVAFIHCDYITYGINDHYSRKIYNKFDKIAAVSDSVKNVFLSAEPQFAEKTFTVRNCNNAGHIVAESQNGTVVFKGKGLNILTVARFGREKGHIRAVEGMKKLKNMNIPFTWHIVGGGDEKLQDELKRLLTSVGLEQLVVLHGDQKNPYKFMPNADFLLVPSVHEAAPMVFDEARILHLPVVTTRTVSAEEFVEQNKIGFVCDNNDTAITEAIVYVATHPDLLKYYRQNTYDISLDNAKPIRQFMKVIGD